MKTEFYLPRIESMKTLHPELYAQQLMHLFKEELTWEQVSELSSANLIKLMISMRDAIKINQSSIDILKLTRAIQYSRSGLGLCVMTPYTCSFCGKEEVWSNSAVPQICTSCASEMATNIATHYPNFYKEEPITKK